MADLIIILLIGIFLPLFPMSMVFNAILDKVGFGWARAVLFFIWPLIGLLIALNGEVVTPDWLLPLALCTSFLYALRMLTLRDVTHWGGFLATSLWGLLWLPLMQETDAVLMYGFAIGMSVPLVLLVLLSVGLEQRFGAAYAGLYGGLARTIPRYSGVFATVVVAAIATPLFPTFFIMLDMVVESVSSYPIVTAALLLIWLLWSWAGARLIQGLIVGRASESNIPDLDVAGVGLYAIVLVVLMAGGIYLSGVLL